MSAVVEVVVTGTTELAKKLTSIHPKLYAAAGIAVKEAATLLKETAAQTAPRVSGNLAKSFVIDGPRSVAETWEAQVGPSASRAPYARAVELGLPPRTIYPVRAGALFWPGAAYPVPYVNWPGFEGRRYFEDAYYLALPAYRVIWNRAMEKALA